MQTEHAVCWGAEFPLAGEAEVVLVLWQVPSQCHVMKFLDKKSYYYVIL